jgi:hypothetical protein
MDSTSTTLGKIGLTDRRLDASPQKVARIAGTLYLAIIIAGIFAEFFVRSSLIVSGDAAATANNINAAEQLFRFGFASDLIMILCDVALALVFYVLLKPVSNSLALLAAFFRLVQATILGINLLNLSLGLQLVGGAGDLAAVGSDQTQALGLLYLEAHGIGYSIGLVFFGFSILISGYLIYRSGYIPKILGILLVIAGIGYLVDSFAKFILPNYASYEAIFSLVVFAPAVIAELALALWLLIKGVNVDKWKERALEPA